MNSSVDAIVVGAGSAGCVVARTLCDAGWSVRLLEAGPARRAPSSTSIDWIDAQNDPSLVWPELVVRRHRADPGSTYTRGRGLGGSSAVNGMVVDRPPLDHPMWGPLDPADACRWVLDLVRPERARPGPVAEVFARMGATSSPAWTFEPVELMTRNGRRLDAAEAVLDPRPASLELVGDAAVTRVLVEQGRAVGVERADGVRERAGCVVVCAGAIESPRLLAASGMTGPHLGVGLSDHPSIPITVELPLAAQLPPGPVIAPSSGIVRFDGGHVYLMDHLGASADGRRYGLAQIALLTPTSVGTVGTSGVDFEMLGAEEDRRRFRSMVRSVASEIVHAVATGALVAAFVDNRGTSAAPLSELSDDELDRWIVAHLGGHSHAAASCRLGAAVGADGALIGEGQPSGVHVIDASSFAVMPPVNPQVATMTLARAMAGVLAHGGSGSADR